MRLNEMGESDVLKRQHRVNYKEHDGMKRKLLMY